MDFHSFFKDKKIIVFGGTGSIGSEIVNQLLKLEPRVIRIFCNSENELWESKMRLKDQVENLRFLLGDVRNKERVYTALNNIDLVFNAAAVKHVPISEYNPMEAIDVNIKGVENIIKGSQIQGVEKMIHISTDKAVDPTTVMGATKLLSERLCMSRSSYQSTGLVISCVRFGNVLGSRGSIIPLIKQQIRRGEHVTLTSSHMRRFFMSINDAADLVLKAMTLARGGEMFVLKMPVIKIKDMIEVIIENYAPKVGKDPSKIKIQEIGPRPGEKLNEALLTEIEYDHCFETEEMFAIYSPISYPHLKFVPSERIGQKIKNDLDYSTKNIEQISKREIKKMLMSCGLL